MMVDFREELFEFSSQAARESYAQCVRRGREKARKLRVVICGLARDVASTLHKTIARVERTAELFQDAEIVVYENDSKDVTPYALRGWQALQPNVNVICEQLGSPVNRSVRCLDRAARMALCRNKLRQAVVTSFADRSHVLVLDLDVSGGWSYDGILNTFGQAVDWDFVGANGVLFRPYGSEIRQCYYDVWAFRWPHSDAPCRPEDINPLQFGPGDPMIPVGSCFGGLGIYRMDAFKRCSYDGSDCEHVPFHRKMREAGMGRLYMNPSQLVLYNQETFDAELMRAGITRRHNGAPV